MRPYVPGGGLSAIPRYAKATPDVIDVEVIAPAATAMEKPRKAGDLMASLRDMATTVGRKRMIAGGVGLGGLLAAANEMGDKNESASQNLVDATGAGVGSLAALAPLALGASGPMGWLAAAGLGLAGSQIGKAGLRGATDLMGLTTTETPEAKAIRDSINASRAGITMDAERRRANLPLAEQEMALARQDSVLRMKADLEARQQAAYAQALLAMAQGGADRALGAIPSMAQQVLAMPTPY
jgi:hypothetical protein